GRRPRGAALLPRPHAGPDRSRGGGIRRRAAALAGDLHPAERPMGAGAEPAPLPPPHPPLPDREDREADRPQPRRGDRPDRVLGGAPGPRAGRLPAPLPTFPHSFREG